MSFSLIALSAATLADGPPEPVGEYGGRWIGAREIRILDVSLPAVRRIARATRAVTRQRLGGADVSLDPYGLAVPGDGTNWVLGDRGRFVLRFSEATGMLVEKHRLSDPCQGIATFWDRAAFVAVRLRPEEPLLLRFERGVLRRFSGVASRAAGGVRGNSAEDLPSHLIRNLFRCGSGNAAAVPCWFVAGEPKVLLIARDGAIRPLAVPTFAAPSRRGPAGGDPGAAFRYPVRDAFLVGNGLWILSNQEGDRTPLEDGALRGRHAVFVRERGAVLTLTLDREARAILDADQRNLVVLFADGSIEAVPIR